MDSTIFEFFLEIVYINKTNILPGENPELDFRGDNPELDFGGHKCHVKSFLTLLCTI